MEAIEGILNVTVFGDQKEIDWFKAIDTSTFEQLANSGGERFTKLDTQLGDRVLRTFPSDLKNRVTREKKKLFVDTATFMKGRQIIKRMYEYFNTPEGKRHTIDMGCRVCDVQWVGDKPEEI